MAGLVVRFCSGFASRIRNAWLRYRGMQLEGYALLRAIDVPRQHHRIRIGANAALERGVTLLVSGESTEEAIVIGERVYINRQAMLDASEGITLGSDTMVGPFVYITDHDHTPGPDGRPAGGALVGAPVTIGKRVWIGAHACILKGVHVGDGAIIAAGAVVTHDVAENTTVAGIPARAMSKTGESHRST